MLGSFGNLLEIRVYKTFVRVKKPSLGELTWEQLVSRVLISTVVGHSSKRSPQHVSKF